MSAASSRTNAPPSRQERIQRLLREWREQSRNDHEALFAAHPDLLPELQLELAKLQLVEQALERAEAERLREAWSRLESDWLADEPAVGSSQGGPGTEVWPAGLARPPLPDVVPRAHPEGEPPEDPEGWPAAIGRYRIRGLLGRGGFGRVYLADDEELKRWVAIKVPSRARLREYRDVELYLSEARLLARLDHAAIVPVYDAGRTDDGGCFLVSKYLAGSDLAARLRTGSFPPDRAARLVMTIAEALHYAHGQGVIHRDIKPANILLDDADRPFLVDFGLALQEDAARSTPWRNAGTPAYMSPEQARGEGHRIDGRSDIYSLGLVLYELLTGRRADAEGGRSGSGVRAARRLPAPREFAASVPEELERICLKCLAPRAADRYESAGDLAEDLQYFLRPAAENRELPADREEPAPRVVPKGLRAFEAQDADFFLDLLPGPRDRHGLPESIRRWKRRIEAPPGDEGFAVGVVYGPSGCGKSSFVKAGLIPRLAPHIQIVYVEASTDDTEARLLKRLRARFPRLPLEADLLEAMAWVRRGQGLRPSERLLLVLDQFEQWLHGRDEAEQQELVDALRQCAAQRISCLLLVRDDFWLPLSRFLAALEVDLVQGQNAALVDLFHIAHARHVLIEFGRAYGRLPARHADMTREQHRFVDEALAGLAERERVIPVRLALFAEMVKERPWTPATLSAVGGATGIGVAFLEEVFGARAAEPHYRVHQRAARAVLQSLLPEPGSEIRGYMRSYPELLDLSGYAYQPRAFKELMRILDSETRLLTPVEPAADAGSNIVSQTPRPRYYQLTHDYLVPALRDWLTSKQRATPAGRTLLRLSERSRIWQAHPEKRQLPNLAEWLSIRLLTRSHEWSDVQRKMMRAAGRRHAWTAVMAGLLSAALLGFGSSSGAQLGAFSAQIRARTANLWVALGQAQAIWPLFRQGEDPTMRARLLHDIHGLATTPTEVVAQLPQQNEASVRRGMLLLAGELAGKIQRDSSALVSLHTDPPEALLRPLLESYLHDPDPGIHSAAEWTLWRLGRVAELGQLASEAAPSALTGDRQWYLNRQGHTMMIVAGPAQFWMGLAPGTPAPPQGLPAHRQRIHRSFAIASKETTVAQFRSFLQSRHTAAEGIRPRFELPSANPVLSVTWYEAAAYCNWLSALEGLPQEQWCYLPNSDGKYAEGMSVAPEALSRRGYRLPLESEWEYACRADTTHERFFGDDLKLTPYFAVARDDPRPQPADVATLKPNDWGLFDMLGNAAEWCHDGDSGDSAPDLPTLVRDGQLRAVRGGSFQHAPAAIFAAARAQLPVSTSNATVGFRVAKNYP